MRREWIERTLTFFHDNQVNVGRRVVFRAVPGVAAEPSRVRRRNVQHREFHADSVPRHAGAALPVARAFPRNRFSFEFPDETYFLVVGNQLPSFTHEGHVCVFTYNLKVPWNYHGFFCKNREWVWSRGDGLQPSNLFVQSQLESTPREVKRTQVVITNRFHPLIYFTIRANPLTCSTVRANPLTCCIARANPLTCCAVRANPLIYFTIRANPLTCLQDVTTRLRVA